MQLMFESIKIWHKDIKRENHSNFIVGEQGAMIKIRLVKI